MELLELMKQRYSARHFLSEPIEDEKIEAILQAGRLAPTACNNQPQIVYVIKSKEALTTWAKCTKCHFNEQLVLLTCYDKNQSWKRDYDYKDSGFVDASIVTTHMMLEAYNLGVGSTWIMHFIPEAVTTEYNLPDNIIPVSALAMGYPSKKGLPSPRHSERKDLNETVIYL